MIDSEEGYLFTNDYEYLLNRTDIVPGNKDEQKHLSSTTVFVMELRQRIDSYFNLVIRNVRDRVPKTIGHFLVKKCQDKIQFHLYSEINKNTMMSDILGEHPAITEERDKLKKNLGILKHATKVLQRDPDITNVLTLDDKLERDLREEHKDIRKQAPPSSNRNHRQDTDSMQAKPGGGDFRQPGSQGEYERVKKESINPHMMRAQQQPRNQPLPQAQPGNQPLSQAPPGPKPGGKPGLKPGSGPAFGNLFGD